MVEEFISFAKQSFEEKGECLIIPNDILKFCNEKEGDENYLNVKFYQFGFKKATKKKVGYWEWNVYYTYKEKFFDFNGTEEEMRKKLKEILYTFALPNNIVMAIHGGGLLDDGQVLANESQHEKIVLDYMQYASKTHLKPVLQNYGKQDVLSAMVRQLHS